MTSSSVHQTDHGGIPDDPSSAFDALRVAWRRFKMGGPWTAAYAAYCELCATLSPDQRRELRSEARAAGRARRTSDSLYFLHLYLGEADRQRARTPRAKAKRKTLDAERAQLPERKAAIREYKARSRAKAKAEKVAVRASAVMEVA